MSTLWGLNDLAFSKGIFALTWYWVERNDQTWLFIIRPSYRWKQLQSLNICAVIPLILFSHLIKWLVLLNCIEFQVGCSCGWFAPGCLMEFWLLWRADTHCVGFFFLDLKQVCKVSQSQCCSAEVSLPKNWVNEKPKSLIELNTHSYADVLPSLPPIIYSAFIFLSSTPQPCVLLLFLDNYVSSGDEREVCL